MASESATDPKLELGHVLFIDIVGYSKLLINDQSEILRLLNEAVRGCDQCRFAEEQNQLLLLPTGDGMALVFRSSPEAPARCALELSESLKTHPNIAVRMGIHSGPVNEITDVNGRKNIAGAGINIAQRVMDCGDAGHILLSKRVAEDLEHYREWQPCLHDLGQCEVKHGTIVSVVNLYNDLVGNREIPQKFRRGRRTLKRLAAKPARRSLTRAAILLLGSILLIGGLLFWRTRTAQAAKLRQGIAEYPQLEAQVHGSEADRDPGVVQEQTYIALAKQLGVDPQLLREKLPRFAEELKQTPNAGDFERANASYVAKDYAEAERLALLAAAGAQKNSPGNSKSLLSALELAGLSAFKAIEYSRAMQHFRESERLTDPNHDSDEWVRLQHEIADLLVAQGKYGDAEKVFRSVINLRSSTLGPEHPDTLDSRQRLIYALSRQTKYAEAETEARDVLRLREKALGPEHVDTLLSRYNLAEPLVDQGKYAEAEELYQEVIRLGEKIFGPGHPRTLAARVGLATVLGDEGRNSEAEPLYREIIKLDEKIYGSEHPYTLNDRQNLATALQANGKYREAEKQYRGVIKIDEKIVGPEHPDTLICRNNLAELLDEEGKYVQAEAECREIIGIEEKAVGPESQLTLNSRGNLALALIGQSKFGEAEAECSDVLKRMEHALGLEHPDTLTYASKFATALAHQNKVMEAMDLSRQLEEHARKVLGPENPSTQKYAKLRADLEAPR